jgi:16S rRNA (guanine1516-N2)-methyltransferase
MLSETEMNGVVLIADDDADMTVVGALAARLNLPIGQTSGAEVLVLRQTADHLELVQTGPGAPGPVFVDFVAGAMGHRRKHGGGRGQLVARAVGIKKDFIPTVIDATAGLGRDSFVLAQLGCAVRMIERSAVVAELLRDGMRRGERDEEVREVIARMSLMAGDAKEYLLHLSEAERPDVVYLDPMHPERSKSAAVKKEMRLFRELVGGDEDAVELLQAALKSAKKRVVVKRPRKAAAISGPGPDLVFEGKSTRFDVYLIPA